MVQTNIIYSVGLNLYGMARNALSFESAQSNKD